MIGYCVILNCYSEDDGIEKQFPDWDAGIFISKQKVITEIDKKNQQFKQEWEEEGNKRKQQ